MEGNLPAANQNEGVIAQRVIAVIPLVFPKPLE